MVTHLSPQARTGLRVGGSLLVLAGLILTVIALADFFSAFNEASSLNGPSRGPTKFWMAFVGLPLMTLGGALLMWGFMGAMAGVAATETGSALEYSSAALARGVRRGWGATPLAVAGKDPLVKVKCRHCGNLDSEDATFCSTCGKRI